jgi:pyrimidine deaminase RibD-like protein
MTPEQDRAFMAMALHLSTKSVSEDDGRIHPFVGAVIAHPDGHLISSGYRGQHTPGNHAEQEALVGITESVVRGSIVYSTLEPCTSRGRQTPCCLRLLNAGVAEVVIGILDPNPDIRGKGEYKFEDTRVRVRKFNPDLVDQIRWLNREFIEYQLGVGPMITTIQKMNGKELLVTEDHRSNSEQLVVDTNGIAIRGTYRVRPTPGDRIILVVRRHGRYYPQQTIDFNHDKERSIWQVPYAWIATGDPPVWNEIIIARLSEDLSIAFKHYDTVQHHFLSTHKMKNQWVGFELNPEPPGFQRLASLTIMGKLIQPLL